MPNTNHVNPGDLITAQLMNEILQRLANLDALVGQAGGSGSATVTVPVLYGRTLTDVQSILASPAQQLNLGSILDAGGNAVNPNAQGSGNRIVIGQMPQPGTRVAPQSSVDLLLAAPQSSGPSQPSLPIVNQITPSSAPVGSQITIFGSNFAPLHTANTVRFNGVTGNVQSTSNTQQLFVLVPAGIPNAPNAPGGPALTGVQVTVTTSAGTSATPGVITVTAPVPSAPTITGTNPQPPQSAIVGQSLTITGTNFSTTPSQNAVTIAGTPAPVTSATPTQLVVTVPMISGLNNIGDTRNNVPVVVTVNAVASPSRSINVTRLT